MKKCCIFHNYDKKLAEKTFLKIWEYLSDRGVEVLEESHIEEVDFAIVIGGDGTFLRASKQIIKNEKIEVIAINAGSLGFLTEIKVEEAFIQIENYFKGEYKIKKRAALEVSVKGRNYTALNEIVISKGGVMTKLLKISVYDNGEYINTYRADGLILATPTGSTAYAMSAGGPIILPELEVFELVPIAPHNLSHRPIIISGTDEVTFVLEEKFRNAYLVIDGDECIEIDGNDRICAKYSGKHIKFILPKKMSHYAVLREKLKWGDKLC